MDQHPYWRGAAISSSSRSARKLGLIYGEGKKTDRLDAQNLFRLARLDQKLLSLMRHRDETFRRAWLSSVRATS